MSLAGPAAGAPFGRRRRSGLAGAAAVVLTLTAACQAPASAAVGPCGGPPSQADGPAACQTCAPKGGWPAAAGPAPACSYSVVRTYPHDPQAFTEGLVYLDGQMYEGTGLPGRSSLRRVDLETGQASESVDLAAEHFGEGVTVFGGRILQLTWRSQMGFVYDRSSLKLERTFTYATEGWGLTQDGHRLILSDGTDRLYFYDPASLAVVGQVEVRDGGQPVLALNELESINGLVYANVWHTDRIARIDPATGQVLSWIDLSGLRPAAAQADPEAVLNGIAYDAAADRLLVTGKLWPALFEIRLTAAP